MPYFMFCNRLQINLVLPQIFVLIFFNVEMEPPISWCKSMNQSTKRSIKRIAITMIVAMESYLDISLGSLIDFFKSEMAHL